MTANTHHPPKATRLRDRIAARSGPPVLTIEASSAWAARLAESKGAEALWLSSVGISATVGVPDRSLIGLREMSDVAHRLDVATTLPLIVDIDEGYGTAESAARATRELSSIGIAGACIEDNAFPKRNSLLLDGQMRRLEEPAEFVAKLYNAKSAQRTDDFLVIARCEALIAGEGIDAAMLRAAMYADAGADMILIHSRRRDGLEAIEIAHRWDRGTPLLCIPTLFPHITRAILGELGYRMVIYANQVMRASIRAAERALETLVADRALELERDIATLSELFALGEVR